MKRKRWCLGMGEDKRENRISSLPEDEGEDRISLLPEDLLCRILSLIPLREAVRTPILSSQWKNLWTLNTSFNLVQKSDERPETFDGSVSLVLKRCEFLKKFCLKYQAGGIFRDLSLVNEWISSAVNREPKLLLLIFGDGIDFRKVVLSSYPTCNITYNTCVVLNLGLFFKVNIPDSLASFPCLKLLKFTGWFPYENHCSALDRLISHSPMLEIIQLTGFLDSKKEFPGSKTNFKLDSRIPTLKILEIRLKTDAERVHPHTVTIDASKLQFLNIIDTTCAEYVMKNLGSLEFVQLYYGAPKPEISKVEHIRRLRDVLFGIDKTDKLAISATALVNPELSVNVLRRPWPQFSHLTTLELRGCGLHHDWTLLQYFLKNSPKLVSLRLYKLYGKDHPWDNGDDQYEWNYIPDCLKLTLNDVDFLTFKGREDELQLAEYILKNARVLQVMRINTYHCPLEDELKEKLLMCKTASKTCQVHFYKVEDEKIKCLFSHEYYLQVQCLINSIKETI